MSCLEFLGCLLQFMEYLSREKNLVNVLGEGEGCAHTQGAFLFVSDRSPYVHTCSGPRAGGWIDLRCLPFVSAQKLLLWFPRDGSTLCALIHGFMYVFLCQPGLSRGTALVQVSGELRRFLVVPMAGPGQVPCRALLQAPAADLAFAVLAVPQHWSQHRFQTSPLHPQFSRACLQK